MEAITNPWQSRIITPILALSRSLKTAPSKFILKLSLEGASHLDLALTTLGATGGCAVWNSRNDVMALCMTWSRGRPGGENLTLFLLNQIVHVIVANSSTLQADSNTAQRGCAKSEYLEVCLKLHCGSSSQTCDRIGQDHRECNTSSRWLE